MLVAAAQLAQWARSLAAIAVFDSGKFRVSVTVSESETNANVAVVALLLVQMLSQLVVLEAMQCVSSTLVCHRSFSVLFVGSFDRWFVCAIAHQLKIFFETLNIYMSSLSSIIWLVMWVAGQVRHCVGALQSSTRSRVTRKHRIRRIFCCCIKVGHAIDVARAARRRLWKIRAGGLLVWRVRDLRDRHRVHWYKVVLLRRVAHRRVRAAHLFLWLQHAATNDHHDAAHNDAATHRRADDDNQCDSSAFR